MSPRRILVSIHRWVGLALGTLLFLQGLTGASMVFRDELHHAFHHDALTVIPAGPKLPVQGLLDQTRKLHPTLQVVRIDYPKQADEALLFRMQAPDGHDIRYISVDPYRGTITRDAPLLSWPAHWLFELHQGLLAGPVGMNVVGVEAVALLTLVAVGLFLWWPGRRRLAQGFSVCLGSGAYRGLRDVHRVSGAIFGALLVITACTGTLVVWDAEIRNAAANLMPMTLRPAPKIAKRTDMPLRPVDDFVAMARARYGDALVKSVRFPGGHGRVVAVYLQALGSVRPRATDQIWFDGYTGAQLGLYEAASLPAATTVLDWMLPVHTGQALGMPGRVAFLLSGLVLSAMALTGLLQWYERRQLMQRGITRM